jgi:serine/threonine-protein kinase
LLEHIVLHCLEKERENRFPNVAELAVALLDLAPRCRPSVERISRVIHAAGLSSSGQVVMPAPVSAKPAERGATVASWGYTGGRTKRDRKALLGVLGGAVLVLALAGGLVATRKPRPAAAPPSLQTVVPSPATPAPASAAPAAAVEVLMPPAAASEGPAPSSRSPGPSAPPRRGAGPIPLASTPHPAAPPAATANCNPPYFIDSAGHRQYKPECL